MTIPRAWLKGNGSYATLLSLHQEKHKDTIKIGPSDWSTIDGDGVITITLHKSEIVELHEDGTIRINLASWPTPMTRQRINQFLKGYNLHQHRKVQTLSTWNDVDGYHTVMEVPENGWVTIPH